MAKNIAIACLTTLLMVTNGWQLLTIVDRSLTISAMNGQMHEYRHSQEALAVLVSHWLQGTPAAEVEALIAELLPDATPFTADGYVYADFLAFKLDETGQYVESVEHRPDR